MYMYIYIYIYMIQKESRMWNVYIYIYIYVCMYVCMHVCIYIYTYKYYEKIYSALLQRIEHCSTRKSTCRLPIYTYIYIPVFKNTGM